jgi:FkbM family methyltransferase
LKIRFPQIFGKARRDEALPVAEDPANRLAAETRDMFTRLTTGHSRPEDFIALDDVRYDASDDWVDGMMATEALHDEDYIVFSHFCDPGTRVLDVGANRGYSVASMRAAGCLAHITSFEVSEAFRSSLQRVKEIEGERYSYHVTGVGATPGSIEFFIPVVNGTTLSALTTGNPSGLHVESVEKNIVDYATSYIETPPYEVRICRMPASIDRLDNLVGPGSRIVAAKFDVEGLEYEALSGAVEILRRDKPLLMIEGGNFNLDVRTFLEGLGYVLAQREGSVLFQPAEPPARSNAFFVCEALLPDYVTLGLWDAGHIEGR